MIYNEYISSPEWRAKRQERLEIDGHRCVVCHLTDDLEVHHLHYESLGNEDALNDLVTVCKRHHYFLGGIEKFQRYSLRKRVVTPIESTVTIRQEISYGMANSEVSIEVRAELPATYAQRADSRPAQQVDEANQTDQWQAEQDRRRLRIHGTT